MWKHKDSFVERQAANQMSRQAAMHQQMNGNGAVPGVVSAAAPGAASVHSRPMLNGVHFGGETLFNGVNTQPHPPAGLQRPRYSSDQSGYVTMQYAGLVKHLQLPHDELSLSSVKLMFLSAFRPAVDKNLLCNPFGRIFIQERNSKAFVELDDVRKISNGAVLELREVHADSSTFKLKGPVASQHTVPTSIPNIGNGYTQSSAALMPPPPLPHQTTSSSPLRSASETLDSLPSKSYRSIASYASDGQASISSSTQSTASSALHQRNRTSTSTQNHTDDKMWSAPVTGFVTPLTEQAVRQHSDGDVGKRVATLEQQVLHLRGLLNMQSSATQSIPSDQERHARKGSSYAASDGSEPAVFEDPISPMHSSHQPALRSVGEHTVTSHLEVVPQYRTEMHRTSSDSSIAQMPDNVPVTFRQPVALDPVDVQSALKRCYSFNVKNVRMTAPVRSVFGQPPVPPRHHPHQGNQGNSRPSRSGGSVGSIGSVKVSLPFMADLEQAHCNIHNIKGQLKTLRQEVVKSQADQKKWLMEMEQRICVSFSTFEALMMQEEKVKKHLTPHQKLSMRVEPISGKCSEVTRDVDELDVLVEEMRLDSVEHRCKVNGGEVRVIAAAVDEAEKALTHIKSDFVSLKDEMKPLMEQELEVIVKEEKFVKHWSTELEEAVEQCKEMKQTLSTLSQLAEVQNELKPKAPNLCSSSFSTIEEGVQGIVESIAAVLPNHEERLKAIKLAEAAHERKKKLMSQCQEQPVLEFEKALNNCLKSLKKTTNFTMVENNRARIQKDLIKDVCRQKQANEVTSISSTSSGSSWPPGVRFSQTFGSEPINVEPLGRLQYGPPAGTYQPGSHIRRVNTHSDFRQAHQLPNLQWTRATTTTHIPSRNSGHPSSFIPHHPQLQGPNSHRNLPASPRSLDVNPYPPRQHHHSGSSTSHHSMQGISHSDSSGSVGSTNRSVMSNESPRLSGCFPYLDGSRQVRDGRLASQPAEPESPYSSVTLNYNGSGQSHLV